MSETVHAEILRGGDKWSRVLRRGEALRLTDPTGCAAVAGFFFQAQQPLERYNMPDTLKAQYTAFLTQGRVLYSDMGRILLSITQDTCGWHDTLSGHQDARESLAQYGPGTYQQLRNDYHRNTRDNFLAELVKHGLGRRDLHANVNFFVKVVTDEDGRLRWQPGNARAGCLIELRAEMDVLCVLSNTPHPLDPATTYAPPPVELLITRGPPAGPTDPCRTSRPENARGFQMTEGNPW